MKTEYEKAIDAQEPAEVRKACPRGCGEAIGHAAVCRSLGDKQTDPVLRTALWDAAALLYEQAAQIERLAEALRPHIDDLLASADVARSAGLNNAANEFAKAASELRAALDQEAGHEQ